jgi:hypothetical protein
MTTTSRGSANSFFIKRRLYVGVLRNGASTKNCRLPIVKRVAKSTGTASCFGAKNTIKAIF